MTLGDPAPSVPEPVAERAIETFAALAAHQLGEAVALVRGAASVIDAHRDRLGPGGEDALRAMGAGTERAQRFVDDLLDLVRASHALEIPPSGTRLDGALDAAAAELERPLGQAGVVLHREPLPSAAVERIDAERLFVHLLRSAVAAGASRIDVTGGPESNGHVRVALTDDGAPPREGPSPFEPFARPRGRGPLVGAGVSLVVCRALTVRVGGTIALDAREDETVVTVRLPAA
jgi:signal transduction histidine kinase